MQNHPSFTQQIIQEDQPTSPTSSRFSLWSKFGDLTDLSSPKEKSEHAGNNCVTGLFCNKKRKSSATDATKPDFSLSDVDMNFKLADFSAEKLFADFAIFYNYDKENEPSLPPEATREKLKVQNVGRAAEETAMRIHKMLNLGADYEGPAMKSYCGTTADRGFVPHELRAPLFEKRRALTKAERVSFFGTYNPSRMGIREEILNRSDRTSSQKEARNPSKEEPKATQEGKVVTPSEKNMEEPLEEQGGTLSEESIQSVLRHFREDDQGYHSLSVGTPQSGSSILLGDPSTDSERSADPGTQGTGFTPRTPDQVQFIGPLDAPETLLEDINIPALSDDSGSMYSTEAPAA